MTDSELVAKYEDLVRRQVFWGESRKTVTKRLVVNGATRAQAESLYRQLFRERVRFIRHESCGRIWKGVGYLSLAGCVLFVGWLVSGGFTVWTNRIIILPALPSIYGLWHLCMGVSGLFTATIKSGSLAGFD
ncbi:hypothetical protein AAFN60_09205 [Roseibacillus persicicus]|uniref:hypothetical protein n=1 Tax=Roseibacillus persicicus TaxID=454148 RepID=UPI00398BAD97